MKTTFKRIASSICAVALATTMLASTTVSASALSYDKASSAYKSGKYYTNLTKVTLTGEQRKDIINVAKSQVGYHEGNCLSQLAGYTANGSANYTEYGKWYGCQDMWSAMFVSWCANMAGIDTTIVPKHKWTDGGLNEFMKKQQAYTRAQVASGEYTPQAGDIIYFKSNRNNYKTNHVGIVTKYSNGKIYTVEGNESNAVKTKSYSINDTYITYICKPAYENNKAAVKLNKSKLTLCDGKIEVLKPTVTGSVGGTITSWKSSNTKVATVTSLGMVKAVDPGITTITVTLANGSKATCVVIVTNVSYFSKCASSYTSIVDALKSINVDSSYVYRKKIATANGISNYTGTATQNSTMLKLLKAGKLIKP